MQTLNLKRPTNGQEHEIVQEIDQPKLRRPNITKISYSRRFSLPNYEHEVITVDAELNDDCGSPEDELLAIRQLVAEHCTTRLRQRALAAQAAKKAE